MKISLRCRGYRSAREVGHPVTFNADFVLMGISAHDSEKIAEALKRIEIMLSGDIDLVKSVEDKPRCFYCGSLNESDGNLCSQCGASL